MLGQIMCNADSFSVIIVRMLLNIKKNNTIDTQQKTKTNTNGCRFLCTYLQYAVAHSYAHFFTMLMHIELDSFCLFLIVIMHWYTLFSLINFTL